MVILKMDEFSEVTGSKTAGWSGGTRPYFLCVKLNFMLLTAMSDI